MWRRSFLTSEIRQAPHASPPRPVPDTAIREALATQSECLALIILRLVAELGLRSVDITLITATVKVGWENHSRSAEKVGKTECFQFLLI